MLEESGLQIIYLSQRNMESIGKLSEDGWILVKIGEIGCVQCGILSRFSHPESFDDIWCILFSYQMIGINLLLNIL